MELRGESVIAAPRERVWAALNDPAVLARCIEGVERLDRVGDDRFEGKLNARVGPVRATFTGGVTLTEVDPPNGYVLVGEGKGGVAGFAKGSADVRLTDEGDATRLAYVARSTVGGKLAQLGSRLIEGAAKGYAETFFARFKAEVEGAGVPAEPPADEPNLGIGSDAGDAAASIAAAEPSIAAQGPLPPSGTEAPRGLPPLVWGGLIVLLTLVALGLMLA